MKYTQLKNSELKISQVSFGCMSLKPGQDHSGLIAEAIDGGINLFDTADLYDKGENEIILGKALKGKRKDVLISTKAGNKWRAEGSGWDWCPEKKYILEAADKSLKRLQTDYIDLYLLHGGTIDDPMDETIEAFERLKEQGKIRAYGISSIRPNVIREYVSRSNISAVMTQYSLLDRRPEEQTLELLHDNNIGIMARGTVAGGLLAGKPATAYLDMDEDKVAEIIESIKGIIHGRSLTESALRYVVDNPAVTTAVVGMRTQKQLYEALKAAASTVLTKEEYTALAKSWEGTTYKEHR